MNKTQSSNPAILIPNPRALGLNLSLLFGSQEIESDTACWLDQRCLSDELNLAGIWFGKVKVLETDKFFG